MKQVHVILNEDGSINSIFASLKAAKAHLEYCNGVGSKYTLESYSII